MRKSFIDLLQLKYLIFLYFFPTVMLNVALIDGLQLSTAVDKLKSKLTQGIAKFQ